MASTLNPYLNFNSNAREAMEFYKDVFGGTLNVTTFAELGAAEGADADKVMHAQLVTDAGYTLMGSDTPSHLDYHAPAGFGVSLSGDDGDRLRGYWDKLSDGGRVDMPLQKQVWGDEFGMVVDKYGICWLVNIAQPQS
ncbi:MAG TPA: VOC family protein [Streptosporangiaceae bacterium]|nr:VOC family protein [Streptosporangiaceae bacterium]